MALTSDAITWLTWLPLFESWKIASVPSSPGLYRIRRKACEELDYIGQTGAGNMTLRRRLAMLKGIWNEQMPYRDPHTAGPGLWALRHWLGCEFEVSVAVITGDTPWRKGLECVAISHYRIEHGKSPTLNFGRMPNGYRMSTSNNAALVAAGKRVRGGPTDAQMSCHTASIPPVGPYGGSPDSLQWCGHPWSDWLPVQHTLARLPENASGLYRLRSQSDDSTLQYIGQGRIRSRIASHVSKAVLRGHPQQVAFARTLECSWVANPAWLPSQLLELECDLIGAYVMSTVQAPPAQFIG